MKNIDCEKCVHCTEWYCEVFGDDPEYAKLDCEKENFVHYKERE